MMGMGDVFAFKSPVQDRKVLEALEVRRLEKET